MIAITLRTPVGVRGGVLPGDLVRARDVWIAIVTTRATITQQVKKIARRRRLTALREFVDWLSRVMVCVSDMLGCREALMISPGLVADTYCYARQSAVRARLRFNP